jgi:phosphohistidine phosphatase
MRTLSLVRHAKAKGPDAFATDFERPLTDRGHKDAVRIAEVLARVEPPVDWIASSPAERTRQTTEHIVTYLDYTKPLQWEDTIYEADADALLRVLSKVPQEVEHVLLVGHNPGLEELAAGLTAGSSDRLNLHLPTAALAHLQLEIFWWNQIRWGCGQLHLLVTPKVVKK